MIQGVRRDVMLNTLIFCDEHIVLRALVRPSLTTIKMSSSKAGWGRGGRHRGDKAVNNLLWN